NASADAPRLTRALRRKRRNGCRHRRNNRLPVSAASLPEQAEARIPGTVASLEEPAPLRRGWQSNPRRPAQRSGKVCDGCVRADDQIEAGHDSRSVEKRLRPLIQLRPQIEQAVAKRDFADLFGSRSLLQ